MNKSANDFSNLFAADLFIYICLVSRDNEFGIFIYRTYEKLHIIQQECSMYVYWYIDVSGYIYIYKNSHI